MSLSSPDIYGAAFAHWRHVQQQLAQTIQDYVDACATLKTALAVSPKDYSARCQQAKAFAGRDAQLPFLASYEERLHDARSSLEISHNGSQSLIPINSLPLEILDTIFLLVVQQGTDAVCDLTSVCKLWRHMTLQSPACWSRIELPFGPEDRRAYARASLWAKRARNELLHISVWEQPHDVEGFQYTTTDLEEPARGLASLMPRVCAMSFTAGGSEVDYLVSRFLVCWAEHGTIGTARILEVDSEDQKLANIQATSSFLATSSLEKCEAFFCSLHTLSLTDAKLDWRLGFYSGLVNLHLGNNTRSLTILYSQWDIAAILAASPRLRSLAIVEFDIGIDRFWDGTPGLVALDDLDTLYLKSSSLENLWIVLRMITSTSDSIRMSLSFENHPEFIPAARSFFERCKVTALHINPPYYRTRPPISSLFTYMPHLKLLALQNRPIFDETWPGSTYPDGSSLDLWPQLDELYLTECDVDQEVLSRLVSVHAPQILWVFEPDWDAETRDQAEEMLRQHTVRLVWFDSWADVPVESQEVATGRFV